MPARKKGAEAIKFLMRTSAQPGRVPRQLGYFGHPQKVSPERRFVRLTIGAPQLGHSGEAVLAEVGFGVGSAAAGARGDTGVVLLKSVFCTSRIIASSASP